MTLIKKNGNAFNSFPSLFDDLFTKDIFDWRNSNFTNNGYTLPAVNVKETADNYEVEMAAPGMSKEDFKIELDNNLLTITSEKESREMDNENDKYARKEFSYQSFQRSFQLAKEVVDADKIEAKYENGLLRLLIPKREEVKQKPSRLIQIS